MLTPTVSKATSVPKPQAINILSEADFASLRNSWQFDISTQSKELQTALMKYAADRDKLTKRKLQYNRKNPATLVEIGNKHLRNGSFVRAKNAYLSALRIDDKYLPAYLGLLDSLIGMKRFDHAIFQADRGLGKVENNERLITKKLYSEIQLLNSDTDSGILNKSTARNDFNAALKQYPESVEINNLLGIYNAVILKEHTDAIAQFRICLNLNSNYADGYNNIALSYWSLNETAKAEANFKKSIDADKLYLNGYKGLLSFYVAREEFSKALGVLELAKQNNLSIENDSLIFGQLYAQNNEFQKGLEAHLEIYETEKNNYKYLNNLGYCYDKLGKVERALECYRKSVNLLRESITKKDNQPPYPFYNLMILASAKKDDTLVKDTAKQLLEMNPNDDAGYYFLSDGGFNRDTAKFAKKVAQRRIEYDENDTEAYVVLSFILSTIENSHEEAIKIISKAPDSVKADESVRNNLAFALIKNGMLDDAQKVLDTSDSTKNQHLIATRGLLSLYRNDFNDAKALYEKALKKYASSDNANKFATQVWAYEKANYFYRNSNTESCAKALVEALELGDVSYAYADSVTLAKKVMKAEPRTKEKLNKLVK